MKPKPKYDSNKHHRRSIRLKGYDYAGAGTYFITICTWQRECLFGAIADGSVQLSLYGQIATNCWAEIPYHFSRVELDEFVIMPNHLHGILVIHENIGDTALSGRDTAMPCPYGLGDDNKLGNDESDGKMRSPYVGQFGVSVADSLPTIIRSFKSAVTKSVNMTRNTRGSPVWQKGYYEHIIRNKPSWNRLREYIQNNPLSWQLDQLHPNNPSKW